MRRSVFIAFFLFISAACFSQVQWASKVLRYSSQYEAKAYSANQVIGKPNALPIGGRSPVAWAPAKAGGRVPEYLWVEFSSPMQVAQIAIGESLNPGSVSKIVLYDDRRRQHVVFERKEVHVSYAQPRMFRHMIDLTDYKVGSVKVYFDLRNYPERVQIDCIGISSDQTPIEAKINTIEYDEPVGKPENLGPGVNSVYDEKSPVISPDGQTLYFTRKYSPQNIGATQPGPSTENRDDIYVSHLSPQGIWGPAYNIGEPVNDEGHNFACAVTPDGNTLLVGMGAHKIGRQGVSISRRTDKGWTKPEFPRSRSMYNDNEFAHYHLGVDGRTLLLAIEQEDSYGDMDIYVSFKQSDNSWTAPMNLGPIINTAGTEGSIFLAADGKTIYFASNGHAGYGSYDMFMSKRLDDSWQFWSEPLNLGDQINTKFEDYYYTIPASGDYAYFSSQIGPYGGKQDFADIYRIKLPKEIRPDPTKLLKGRIVDAETGEPIPGDVFIDRIINGDTLGEANAVTDGNFQVVVPDDGDYSVHIIVPGYVPTTEPVDEYINTDDDNYDEVANEDEIITLLNIELGSDSIMLRSPDEFDPDLIVPPIEPPPIIVEVDEDLIRKQIGDSLRRVNLEWREDEAQRIIDSLTYIETSRYKDSMSRLIAERDDEIRRLRDSLSRLNDPVPDPDITYTEPEIMRDTAGEYTEIKKDIRMTPVKEGEVFRLNNLFFTADRATLKRESFAELNRLVEFMEKNPSISIEIMGHTNGLPSHKYCDKLSKARAKRVRDYLVEHGIKKSRIEFEGYGKRKPIDTNETLEGRKKNQRVEIKIIKVNE